MEKTEQIKQRIQSIVGLKRNMLPFSGKVVSVEGTTCTVEISGGLKISDIRLKSTIKESQNYELRTPAVGSTVTAISLTGDLDNLVVIQYDEIEKYEFMQDGLLFTLDSTDKKISVSNDQVSLLDLFDEVKGLLENFTALYLNPAGTPTPTTADPAMIPKLEQFAVKFKQLLK